MSHNQVAKSQDFRYTCKNCPGAGSRRGEAEGMRISSPQSAARFANTCALVAITVSKWNGDPRFDVFHPWKSCAGLPISKETTGANVPVVSLSPEISQIKL